MFRYLMLSVVLILSREAAALSLHSAEFPPTVIELYTSEGCSSCPPADAWLSSLKGQDGLFSDFVPLAFHVDYWDRLGWKDRFAHRDFSERQRNYRRRGLISQVYTPGFVVDSREWRGWFAGKRQVPSASTKSDGSLQIDWPGRGSGLDFRFHSPAAKGALELHLAYLGMGVCNAVNAGENRGRRLCHDFVVLKHHVVTMASAESGRYAGTVAMPSLPEAGQARTALAVWVSRRDSPAIIQAVAGYLPGGGG
jgi:hypothetical protein